MLFVFILAATKFPDEPSPAVKLNDVIGAVSICHIDVSIRSYCSFCGAVCFVILVRADGMGLCQRKNDPSLDVCLHHITGLCF